MIVGDLVKYSNAYCEDYKAKTFSIPYFDTDFLSGVALVTKIATGVGGYGYAVLEWVGIPDPVHGGIWKTTESLDVLEVV